MQKLLDLLKKHKQTLAIAIVAALSLYNLWQTQPQPPQPTPDAAMLARVTPTPVKATATPRPARATLTATFTPSVTQDATNTPAPSLTPTSMIVGHDVTIWHAPGVAGHQHGLNPLDAHPEIVAWLETHKWGSLFSSVGTLWASSPIENLFPWPLGKHEGFVFLAENDTHCDQFDPGGKFAHGNCINAYLFQVHALGNAAEYFALKHSDKGVFYVCDQAGVKCGIVATGGVTNYGERHNAYKKDLCLFPGIPVYEGNDSLNQPPYVAVAGSKRQTVFWSSLLNFTMEKYFTPVPNRLLQVAWNNRPFSVTAANSDSDPNLCADLDVQMNHDNPENRNNTFQVFTLLLYLDQFPRPFEGYTNLDGVEDKTCTAPSAVCVPLYIGADVPLGNATLNRPVMHGDPEAAPIQVYGQDVLLLPPGQGQP